MFNTEEELCNICFTSILMDEPCVKLGCKHAFRLTPEWLRRLLLMIGLTTLSPVGLTASVIDFSPFRRGYTRGGVATNGALVRLHQGSPGSAPRTSFQQLQESPINNIRRSCPQSPRTLTQTNGHGMFCFFHNRVTQLQNHFE